MCRGDFYLQKRKVYGRNIVMSRERGQSEKFAFEELPDFWEEIQSLFAEHNFQQLKGKDSSVPGWVDDGSHFLMRKRGAGGKMESYRFPKNALFSLELLQQNPEKWFPTD